MAKDNESLEKSREIRSKILAKYGFIPTSIISPNYAWGKHVIELDERKQDFKAVEKHIQMKYNVRTFETQSGETKQFNQSLDEFAMSSKKVRGKTAGLSTFPPDLARFIVLFYSEEGDHVGDPFAGHNSRMQVTYELNRSYTGYDICKEFIEFMYRVAQEIQGKGSQQLLFKSQHSITIREQTSEHMVEADNTFDMIYTSPPYSVEFYDDNPLQIGYKEDYKAMLQRLMQVLSECYRTLKKDKFCIWNINDFRKDNVFYPFHVDIIKIFQKIGFKLHDIGIIKWQGCLGSCFASQLEERKMLAKSHEYIVVGKKV